MFTGGGRIRTDDNGFAIRRLRPLGYAASGSAKKGILSAKDGAVKTGRALSKE